MFDSDTRDIGTPGLSILEKYRPQSFADIVGQELAIRKLSRIASQPRSQAVLLTGPTGTGKTSAARCLAIAMNVNADFDLHVVKSGDMDASQFDTLARSMATCGVRGGWKLVIVEECELMSAKAQGLWLSALDDIPARVIVVFTTNHPGKLDQRFQDRCTTIAFDGRASHHYADAQAYLARVWNREALNGTPPDARQIPSLVDADGMLSYRRIASYVEDCADRLSCGEEIELGAKPSAVASAGISPSAIDWEFVADEYRAGASHKALAARFGVSHGTVQNRLRAIGVVSRECAIPA